jgi:hypothetical protein
MAGLAGLDVEGGVMNRGRLMVGGVLLALLGLQGWTQYLAYHYLYHPALGTPWWTLKGSRTLWASHSLYAPWMALVWEWRWGSVWLRLGLVGGVCGVLGLLVVVWWVSKRWAWSAPPEMTGHGTTKWAETADVKKAGLL